jgi:hypothetical protein
MFDIWWREFWLSKINENFDLDEKNENIIWTKKVKILFRRKKCKLDMDKRSEMDEKSKSFGLEIKNDDLIWTK